MDKAALRCFVTKAAYAAFVDVRRPNDALNDARPQGIAQRAYSRPTRFDALRARQAIMSMLEKMLGDSWTSETAKAWTELWDSSATAMMKADPGPPRFMRA